MPGVTTAMNTSDAAFVVLAPTAFGAAKAFVVLPPAIGRPMISHVGRGNDYDCGWGAEFLTTLWATTGSAATTSITYRMRRRRGGRHVTWIRSIDPMPLLRSSR